MVTAARRRASNRSLALTRRVLRPALHRTLAPRRPRATITLLLGAVALAAAPTFGATSGSALPAGQPLAKGLADSVAALEDAQPAASTAAPAGARSEPGNAAETRTPVFAEIDGLELRLPATDLAMHAFHQAGSGRALALTPVGTLDAAATAVSYDGEVRGEDDGPVFSVLPSRGRGTSPTSAVDLALEEGIAVLSPVDGTVTTVTDYQLYGQHPDTLIHIQPDDAPHLRVVLLHVEGVTVAEGERVEAGLTVVADSGRKFSFSSQIDRFVGAALPHVHIEVVPGDVAT